MKIADVLKQETDAPCYVVAEIGINHNGSLQTAKDLIDAAVYAGCNAVKFQKRTILSVYTKEELDKPRNSPFGTTNRDLKYGLEFGGDSYAEIDQYCRKKSIEWFASPWDEHSVEFLDRFNVAAMKIASACITDLGLVQKIGRTLRPILMSTGMSEKYQIDVALDTIGGWAIPVLLACTSTYPTELKDLNLARIKTLGNLYPNNPIGYSGHEVGLWSTLCAVAMGARVVERHITLDRSMWGSDQAASVEPAGFARLVKEIRDFEKARGSGKIAMMESERPVMEKLRRVK